MALSVSGFPEPARQLGAASSIEALSTTDNDQEGSTKSSMMNSPRLRGLFGGGGNGVSSGKKAASPGEGKPTSTSSTSSKADENDGFQTVSSSPSSSALTFSPSFEPLSQQKYDFDTPPLPMYDSGKGQTPSKRAQPLPPLPRKAKASPVRLGPSLTRLDIGAVGWSRLPMASHIPSKPPPPSVVIEEWTQKETPSPSSTTSQTRPLPTLPAPKADSSNSLMNTSVAGPSRHVNAVSSSPEQSNAVAGPSQYPGALVNALTTAASSLSPSTSPAATPAATPASKVLIIQPIPQRTKKHSLTMRYQPLVAGPSTSAAATSSSGDVTSFSAQSGSPIRPLPRIPPIPTLSLNATSTGLPTISSLPADPLGTKTKRPKTSPGIITGLPTGPRGPVSANTPTLSRSPFASITTSWPARQWEVANNPLPISSPLKPSRARSHSRLSRRDRSLDSYYPTHRTSPATSRVPSPIGGRPSHAGSRSRSVKHATTIDYLPQSRGSPTIPGTPFAGTMALQIHIADPVVVGKRPRPPSPPTGPVKPRPKTGVSGSPPISRILTAQPLSHSQPSGKPSLTTPTPISAATTATIYSANTTPPTTAPLPEDSDDMYSIDAPLHSHPIDSFTDTESMANPALTPTTPVEVYIDDEDYSTMSRSPSPIRYARPDSRGHLSSSDDDDGGIASSSSSESDGDVSPGPTRRRTQLRSYRNSYRPHEGASPPHIPYRRSPSPISEQQSALGADVEKKKTKKKAARSYFSEYIAISAPVTRASSPERKSRSRQPRKPANTVSLALRNSSLSPKRDSRPKALALLDGDEVLDIGPIPPGDAASSISETVARTSSLKSSAKVGWVKSMAKKRSDVFLAAAAALNHNSVSHLSNAGTAPVEMDGAETPYMWISTSKPPVTPAPFIPVPLPHRRVDSADYLLSNSFNERERESEKERENENCNLTCGLPLSTGPKPRTSDPPSTMGQSHTSSSSISVPSSSFSGFGITSRTRKPSKHVSSASVPFQLHFGQPTQTFEPTLNITRQNYRDATDAGSTIE